MFRFRFSSRNLVRTTEKYHITSKSLSSAPWFTIILKLPLICDEYYLNVVCISISGMKIHRFEGLNTSHKVI